jgi:Ribbon-helix-helix protein, copG family
MRTTITLDDRLLERLKKRAAESGTNVSGLIERAVRLLLRAPAPQGRDSFELVTFGEGGQFTPLNVDKSAALLEADDIERFGRQR